MKYAKYLVPVLLLCMIPASLVFGQRKAGTFSIGAYANYGLPMGPEEFKDYFDPGIGFGGEIGYNIGEKTTLAASFTAAPFKIKTDAFTEEMGDMEGYDVEVDGGNLRTNIISVGINQYFTAPDAALGFFVAVAGGYYMMSAEDATITVKYQGETVYDETMPGGDADNKFGANAGVGLEFQVAPIASVFAGAKYHYVFTEDDATSFVTIFGGVRFQP